MIGPADESFDHERFQVRRQMGTGGFGEVYEAFDRERSEIVAVKVLRRSDAATIYRFKQEFRNLADLAHPNLVTLHELISDGDRWLLTMELVRGVNFVEYVRPRSTEMPLLASPHSLTSAPTVTSDSDHGAWPPSASPGHSLPLGSPLDPGQINALRAGLRQLAEGVSALHQSGILHLDIKPSNVLVDEAGRVVIIDFGLAQQLGHGRRSRGPREIAGTPEYMSPEQAAAGPLSEASDWYSVGALLYRTLTGLSAFPTLTDKLYRDAPRPGEIVSATPADLDSICQDLLRREPRSRPSGIEVLVRVGSEPARAWSHLATRVSTTPFVGRAAHLATLHAAFQETREGRPAVVYVRGKSGMGKTALVRQFLDHLPATAPDVVVLAGRCYEHEAMPFKAFDGIVDALSAYLQGLSDTNVASLLPRGVALLGRVFPVLGRVPAIGALRHGGPAAEPQTLQRRAFAALRDFFGRIAEHSPLVFFIDDLQWGDVDSLSLLDEIMRPPDPPPLLLIATYRSDEVDSSACLRALIHPDKPRDPSMVVARQLDVAELDRAEAEELARTLLPRANSATDVDVIARESQGNPFFIDQLVRHTSGQLTGRTTLEAVLTGRTLRLAEPSRRLMEVVAVAGKPLHIAVAAQAADIGAGKYDLLAALKADRLVRSHVRGSETEVEAYHDRIRETIVHSLPPDVRARHHLRLAVALEESGTADPETLAFHFRDGGQSERAAKYAVAAAEQSARALAFDGAARLYRMALELQPADRDVVALRVSLGDALAMAGRVIESAEAYLAAAEGSSPAEQVDLRRRAGEQYLLGGHLEDALRLLEGILAGMGMALPSTPRRAFFSLIARQMQLRLRGLHFHERPEHEVPRSDLERLDTCHAVCRGLGFTDSVRAIELQSRHLLLALRAGEPYRVARALTFSATADGVRARTRPRAEKLLAEANRIAERIRNPHATGLIHSVSGLIHLAAGRCRPAVEQFDAAETIFREKCTTVPYETVLCYVYKVESLFMAGAIKEYFRLIPEYLAVCQGRGDLFGEANLRMRNAHVKCFAEDDPERAWHELRTAESSWAGRSLHLARANYLFRQIELTLYSGDAPAAWRLVTTGWRGLAPLRLFGFQGMTTLAYERRAYCALAMAAAGARLGQTPKPFLKTAERDARQMERWKAPWGAAIAHLVRAAVAEQRGDRANALTRLDLAERGFLEAGMALHLAVTRWRKGSLTGGDAGRVLISEAHDWMKGEGIRSPERMSSIIAPGVWAPV